MVVGERGDVSVYVVYVERASAVRGKLKMLGVYVEDACEIVGKRCVHPPSEKLASILTRAGSGGGERATIDWYEAELHLAELLCRAHDDCVRAVIVRDRRDRTYDFIVLVRRGDEEKVEGVLGGLVRVR